MAPAVSIRIFFIPLPFEYGRERKTRDNPKVAVNGAKRNDTVAFRYNASGTLSGRSTVQAMSG